ncbi:MAG: metallophosphoesterase family protein [Hyphomonas sp.]
MRLWRPQPEQKTARPRGSPGKRLYAIGDVHGCQDELVRLLSLVEADHAARPKRPCHIVFLGDLIDRGPASAGVVRQLRERPPAFADVHFIRGNHEEMMVRALTGEPEQIADWLRHGGQSCALSYGVDPSILAETDPLRLEHNLLSHIPEADIRFLAGFVDQVRFGDYLLVHAGLRPGIPISAQSGRDLRWIRAEFLESEVRHEAVVVHGHTITETVEMRPNRIGLDTGAYRTGVLSALRIEEDETSILMTGPQA